MESVQDLAAHASVALEITGVGRIIGGASVTFIRAAGRGKRHVNSDATARVSSCEIV